MSQWGIFKDRTWINSSVLLTPIDSKIYDSYFCSAATSSSDCLVREHYWDQLNHIRETLHCVPLSMTGNASHQSFPLSDHPSSLHSHFCLITLHHKSHISFFLIHPDQTEPLRVRHLRKVVQPSPILIGSIKGRISQSEKLYQCSILIREEVDWAVSICPCILMLLHFVTQLLTIFLVAL